MGKGSSAPAAPDPVATAQAQGTANIQAAQTTAQLNRPNQTTPFGALTWQQGGSKYDAGGYDAALKAYQAKQAGQPQGPAPDISAFTHSGGVTQDGTQGAPIVDQAGYDAAMAAYKGGNSAGAPTKEQFGYDPNAWSSTSTLTPDLQAIVDSSTGNLKNTLSAPVDYSKLPGVSDYNTMTAGAYGMMGDPKQQVAQGQTNANASQGLVGDQTQRLGQLYGTDFNYNNLDPLQKFNTNGVAPLPSATDTGRNQVTQALYDRATARLDPRYGQAQSDLDSRLAAQGITQGSEAYNREQNNLGMQRNDAYSSATNDAIAAGGAEQSRLVNLGLGVNAQDMANRSTVFTSGLAARQQGVGEANTMRALPTQEALAASTLNSANGQDLRGYIGTQGQNLTTAANVGGSILNAQTAQRGNNLQEQLGNRQQVLNEFNALRTGSPMAGQSSQAMVAPAPVAQSIYNSYQGQLNSASNQTAQQNGWMNGLAQLGAVSIGG